MNRIELKGFVGQIRIGTVGDKRYANLSVATNYIYKDDCGTRVIETTWHSVSAFDGEGICPLDDIRKGDKVHVVGRLRTKRYVDSNNVGIIFFEVVASFLEKISEE